MDFWDGLQAYDLMNDGNGNYGFVRGTSREKSFHAKETVISVWTLFKLDQESKRLAREENV